MNKNEKVLACRLFFEQLSQELPNYVVVGSINNDLSAYLVPAGTEGEITYNGKPANSFRFSDHWNWYANVNKCSNERYVQCLSVDVPFARRREVSGKPTKPRFACQVAVIGSDGKYHAVFGEIFDKKTKSWSWISKSPKEVAKNVLQ